MDSSGVVRTLRISDFEQYVVCRQVWSALPFVESNPSAEAVLRQGLARLGLPARLVQYPSRLELQLRLAIARYQSEVDSNAEALFRWFYELGLLHALMQGTSEQVVALLHSAPISAQTWSAMLRQLGLEGLANNPAELFEYFSKPGPGESWSHFWQRCLANKNPGPIFDSKVALSDEVVCQGLGAGYSEALRYFEEVTATYDGYWLSCLARGGQAGLLEKGLEILHYDQQDSLSVSQTLEMVLAAVDSGDLETLQVALSTDEVDGLSLAEVTARAAEQNKYQLLELVLAEGASMGLVDDLSFEALFDVYEDTSEVAAEDIRLLLLEHMRRLARTTSQVEQVAELRARVQEEL